MMKKSGDTRSDKSVNKVYGKPMKDIMKMSYSAPYSNKPKGRPRGRGR